MNQLGSGKIRDFFEKLKKKARPNPDNVVSPGGVIRGFNPYDTTPTPSPTSPHRYFFPEKVKHTRELKGGWRELNKNRKKLFGL